jgi:hypothetical protein
MDSSFLKIFGREIGMRMQLRTAGALSTNPDKASQQPRHGPDRRGTGLLRGNRTAEPGLAENAAGIFHDVQDAPPPGAP